MPLSHAANPRSWSFHTAFGGPRLTYSKLSPAAGSFGTSIESTLRSWRTWRSISACRLSPLPRPVVRDEADYDASHKGGTNPKADNPAEGGGFRKGLHHSPL